MNSSLGFHTLSLSLPLTCQDIQPLIRDFRTYSQNTGLIQIFHKGMRVNFQNTTPHIVLNMYFQQILRSDTTKKTGGSPGIYIPIAAALTIVPIW